MSTPTFTVIFVNFIILSSEIFKKKILRYFKFCKKVIDNWIKRMKYTLQNQLINDNSGWFKLRKLNLLTN